MSARERAIAAVMPLADGRKWRIELEHVPIEFDGGEPFLCRGYTAVFSEGETFEQGGLALVDWERSNGGSLPIAERGTSIGRIFRVAGLYRFTTFRGWVPSTHQVLRVQPVVAIFSIAGKIIPPHAGELRFRAEVAHHLSLWLKPYGAETRQDAILLAAMLRAQWEAEATRRRKAFWDMRQSPRDGRGRRQEAPDMR